MSRAHYIYSLEHTDSRDKAMDMRVLISEIPCVYLAAEIAQFVERRFINPDEVHMEGSISQWQERFLTGQPCVCEKLLGQLPHEHRLIVSLIAVSLICFCRPPPP